MLNNRSKISRQSIHFAAIATVFLSVAACSSEKAAEKVEPQKVSMRNAPKVTAESVGFNASVASTSEGVCYWNDKKFSDGSSVCDSHQRYKCWSGKWVDIGNC